jgi:cytochrome c oxidase assembly factor CtaG
VSTTAFSFEPLFLALAIAAAALYWRAARTDRPATWRVVAFGAGLFLIAASLNSPLETIAAHYLLLMHLLQNALIADVAPLLVVLGLTPLMRKKLSRRGLGRIRPWWILPIWLGAWYLTHLAPFYDWALRPGWGLNLAYIFSSRPFYAFYEHAPRLWGVSPVRDQNLGGIFMNGEQTLVFLLAIGYFVLRLLDEEHAREEVAAARPKPLSDT